MTKRSVAWIIIISFFVGALGSIVFGRFLIPYVATFKGFSLLNKLSSSSPIVINRREEVQLNEGVNLIDLIKQSGNFTVGIYGPKNNFLGNGIVVTSDGLILTANSIISGQISVSAVTDDSQKFPAALKSADPKTNLALLIISANNLSSAQFDDAGSLSAGHRVIYLGRSNIKFEHKAQAAFVTQSLANQIGSKQVSTDAVLSADYFGGPIVNLTGRVVGMTLDKDQNIISENLKIFLNDYFSKPK
ncbi:MAG: serine protease [Candidatus Doudnabacteria bacterium]